MSTTTEPPTPRRHAVRRLGAACLVAVLVYTSAVAVGVDDRVRDGLAGLVLVLSSVFAIAAFVERARRSDARAAGAYRLMAVAVAILPMLYGVELVRTAFQDGPTAEVGGGQLLLGTVVFVAAWTRFGAPGQGVFGRRLAALDASVAFFATFALLLLRRPGVDTLGLVPRESVVMMIAQSAGLAVVVWVLCRSRERGPVPWRQLALWITGCLIFFVTIIEATDPVLASSLWQAWSPLTVALALALASAAALRDDHEAESRGDVQWREKVSRMSSSVSPTVLFLVLLVNIWRNELISRDVALLSLAALAGVLVGLGVIRRMTVDQLGLAVTDSGRRALEAGEAHPWFETLVGQGNDVVTVIDQHMTVLYQTPSASHVLGYAPGTWTGRDFRDVLAPGQAATLESSIASAARSPQRRVTAELAIVLADGTVSTTDTTVTAIASDGQAFGGFVLTTRLVPESYVPRAEVDRMSATDPLTGRANLAAFRQQTEQAVRVHGRGRVGVLVLDLDGFTEFNDRVGHDQGDDLLRLVSDALARCVRPWDLVARLGADEFGVLVVGPSPERAIARVHERARRVLLGVVLPSGVEVPVTARAGYAVNAHPDTTAAELLRNADLALARARTSRNVQLQPYASSMHAELVARADAETALRRAFDRRELELHYQPVVELPSRRIVGVEALVRWNHPTRGLLNAGEFLGLIVELGLSQRLCSWVIVNSAVAAAAMVAVHPANERVAVGFNVGAEDLVDHLVDEIELAASSAGLTPHRLVVEVTEESLVATDAARDVIARLRLSGFKVAIDDFGVGFSSLSYLADIPVDYLKIDRSFVNDVTPGSTKAALVAAVLALGETLGLETVVEGLETAAEVEVVHSLGARYAQGWHFARAMPLPAVLELLAAQAAQEAASPDGVVTRYGVLGDTEQAPRLTIAPEPEPQVRQAASGS